VRGNTYILAPGTYSGRTLSTPTDGTKTITIKSDGTGQAVFSSGISFTSGYWIFDGVKRTSWTTGYGIKVNHQSGSGFNIEGPNVTIRYVEVQGNGGDGGGSWPNNDSIAWRTTGNGDNTLIQYSYLHEAGRCIFFSNQSVSGVVIEHTYTGDLESVDAEHAEIASIWGGSTDWTWRYNIFTHSEGTGGLILEGNNFKIYGNIFYQPPGISWDAGNGVIGTWTASTLTNAKVYNNSFVNVRNGRILGSLYTSPTTGNEAKNNLFYGVTVPITSSLFPVQSHDHVATMLPFASDFATTLNFSLTANTPAADSTVPAQYRTDMYGRTGTTRGAVQFDGVVVPGDTTAPTVSVTAPAAGATVTGTATAFSATAADNVGVAGVQFRIDGINVGAEDTISPYTVSWNTTSSVNGTHSLTAVARDAAGNTTSSTPVTVTVSNAVIPVSTTLSAYWNLNQTSGTTATDSSGNSRTATLLGSPTWTTGVAGNGLLFNGTSAYVNAGNIGSATFSISAWVNMSSSQSGWGSIAMKQSSFGLEVQNGAVYANVGNGSSWTNTIQAPLASGVWKHVVQTYDGTTNRLYVDGILVASGAGSFTNTSANLLLGSWNGSSEFFNGKIDEVRVYSGALTAAEVGTLFSTITPPSTPTASTRFPNTTGYGVQVTGTGTFLNIRSTPVPTGTLVGTAADGVVGTIVSNVSNGISSGGYYWWYVTLNSITGWVVENYLVPASAPSLSYTLSVTTSGSGSVTKTVGGLLSTLTSFLSGTQVTLTATPAAGYTFSGWSGACSGTGSCTVTMNANTAVTAAFSQIVTGGSNYYVTPTGKGLRNGTNWDNAYAISNITSGTNQGLASSNMTRGATYYLAGGSYPGVAFDDAEDGTKWIKVYKATAANSGGVTGWNSLTAQERTGQAQFTNYIAFARDYYEFDGQTRNELKWNDDASYGFKVSTIVAHFDNFLPGADNIVIKHVSIGGALGKSLNDSDWSRGVQITGGSGAPRTNYTVSNNHIHDTAEAVWFSNNSNGFTIENNFIGPTRGKESIFGIFGSYNVAVRNNILVDNCQDNPLDSSANGCSAEITGYSASGQYNFNNWEVSGNLITRKNAKTTDHSDGSILGGGSSSVTGWNVFNNVVSSMYGSGLNRVNIRVVGTTGNNVYNNIWYDIGSNGLTGCVASTCTNNVTVTTDPYRYLSPAIRNQLPL
ncbi:MAG: LamG-like jellyroll fold domain-containing protein, partial [Patescibacteria group bacterium]